MPAAFVFGKTKVSVIEKHPTDRDASWGSFWVFQDVVRLGEITLPLWLSPSFEIDADGFCVWGGAFLSRFCYGHGPVQVELDEELSSVYRINAGLCLVCELSICLVTLELEQVARLDFIDVIEARWSGEDLMVNEADTEYRLKISGWALTVVG